MFTGVFPVGLKCGIFPDSTARLSITAHLQLVGQRK